MDKCMLIVNFTPSLETSVCQGDCYRMVEISHSCENYQKIIESY